MSVNPTPSSAAALLDRDAPAGRRQVAPTVTGPGASLWGEDGFGFDDLLDRINPLQHLPMIAPLYRGLTGDTLSDGARLIGGAAFGGPVGLVVAFAEIGLREATGRDIGGHLAAALGFSDAGGLPASRALAAASQPPRAAPFLAFDPPLATPPATAAAPLGSDAATAAAVDAAFAVARESAASDSEQRRTALEVARQLAAYERRLRAAPTPGAHDQR